MRLENIYLFVITISFMSYIIPSHAFWGLFDYAEKTNATDKIRIWILYDRSSDHAVKNCSIQYIESRTKTETEPEPETELKLGVKMKPKLTLKWMMDDG
jgi:hypothetical protein